MKSTVFRGATRTFSQNPKTSHLIEVLRAFERLEKQPNTVAIANAGLTRSEGWATVYERVPKEIAADDVSAIFWDVQAHDAFDASGNLVGPLHLAWRGDKDRLESELSATGLHVEAPESPATTFVLRA